jgi:hypothetical protein
MTARLAVAKTTQRFWLSFGLFLFVHPQNLPLSPRTPARLDCTRQAILIIAACPLHAAPNRA